VRSGNEEDCADECYDSTGRLVRVWHWYCIRRSTRAFLNEVEDNNSRMSERWPAHGTLRTRRASDILGVRQLTTDLERRMARTSQLE
jgi:hypothetical protein